MAAMLGDDDFDQFDKPGAERSRRRRATDDDWDSELEDDLLEEDYSSGKKISPDLSDEELNDDLLQSDEEEQDAVNYSSQGVTVSINATAEDMSSFDLSKSINEECTAEEAELEEAENEELYDDPDLQEVNSEELAVDSYEENYDELIDEQVEYAEEEATDEVLELEINEPLDEFQEEDYAQSYKSQEADEEQYMEDVAEDAAEPEDLANESEEVHVESQEIPPDSKEESDEDDDEEEGGGRIRFKTERKEGTIIRLSESTRERRNIPETLELSAEAKASLMEFEEMERQRKQGRFSARRGGRRGGTYAMPGRMGGQRNDYTDRRNLRNRTTQGQPVRGMFLQQHIQPLLPMPRSRNPSSGVLPSPQQQQQQQQEKPRMGTNVASAQKPQPKNIHINPHFKGNVAPVQVPLLPAPNQPRPAMGPPRFPGMPEFQHVPNPAPGNFNPPPRLQEPWRNPPPPPQPEREPFFIGEPRFPNHHIFEQRNPPPGPPPPLLSNNHQVPNHNPPPFNPPGQGFNQSGPQPRFNQAQANFNPPGPGPQTSFNPPTPQSGFNQPGFSQPGPQTGFNQQGPQSGFNPQGLQSGFNASGNQPGFSQPNFNHPSPQPGFNQSGPQPPFNLPGLNQQGFSQSNPGPQPGFNQPGSAPQPNFNQHGPGPQPGFNSPGFSRERPLRMNMPSPSTLGMPPFSPPSANRHFGPPRQQFPPGPGQPFMPHTQSNIQSPMQPIQSMHQHHHLGGPPKPPMPMQQPPPFRAHSQTPSHRMPGQQRHGPLKQRAGMPIQNMAKTHNLQTPHSRNSNLRELPIAPSHSIEMNKRKSASAPAAQVKPVGTTAPQARLGHGKTEAIKPVNSITPVKEATKVEEQFPDEDEETRKYRLKIEEQKRLREEILKQKELRRQQQAGARKKELLERLSQQQPSSSQQCQPEAENSTVKVENNCSQILPHITAQVRPHVRNRPISNKPDSLPANVLQKIPLLQTAGTTASFQGQQKKMIKQTVQNRVAAENQFPKVQQVCPAVSTMQLGLQQTVKVAPVQGKPQEQRLTGAKRTVMQRSNSSSGEAHIAPKVRVIKLSGTGDCVSVQPSEGNLQMQPPQQKIQPQQRPQYQQRVQQKTGPVRKVTLGKGSVQQQQYQVKPRPVHSLTESVVPHVVSTIQGQHPQTKVIMRGRGRGVGGQMGRGRLMPNKQNLRVVECKPQPCVVSVEGLSSSTTDHQLKNLLMSVGPIQNLQMFPHQRKAIATFENPHHASQFQQRFHRHMIDLSHINVSLVTE